MPSLLKCQAKKQDLIDLAAKFNSKIQEYESALIEERNKVSDVRQERDRLSQFVTPQPIQLKQY